MFEQFEAAQRRAQQAQSAAQSIPDRSRIMGIDDIRRVLAELDPANRHNEKLTDLPVTTQLAGKDSNDRPAVFQVTAPTSTKSHRDIIMEGISIVRQRRELAEKIEAEKSSVRINGREMIAPPLMNLDTELGVDPIINRVTGGYRKGEYICWDLPDGFTYKYDIFEHRLTRVQRDE